MTDIVPSRTLRRLRPHPAPLTGCQNTRNLWAIASAAGLYSAVGCRVQQILSVAPRVAPSVALKIKQNQSVNLQVQRCNAIFAKSLTYVRARVRTRAHMRQFYHFTVAPLHLAYNTLKTNKSLVQRWVQRCKSTVAPAPQHIDFAAFCGATLCLSGVYA